MNALIASFAAVAATPIAACAAQPLGQPGTLASERTAARRAGLPIRADEMRAPRLPATSNAATYWRRLYGLHVRTGGAYRRDGDELGGAFPWDASQLRAARAALAKRATELSLIRKAVACTSCEWNRDWAKGPAVEFPELASLRSAARLLCLQASVSIADGHPQDAVGTLARCLRIRRHITRDGFLGALIGQTIDSLALRGLTQAAFASAKDPAALRLVAVTVRSEPHGEDLARALSPDAVMWCAACDLVREGGPKALAEITATASEPRARFSDSPTMRSAVRGIADSGEAYILWQYRLAAQALRMPYAQAHARLSALEADTEKRAAGNDLAMMLPAVLLPQWTQLHTRATARIALSRVVGAAAAVLAWHAEHGAFPETLRSAIRSVPLDPFSDAALRYRRTASGFVVYSVGPTGAWDGGSGDVKPPGDESAFYWPRPAWLK